jgi:2-phospho-L-lactate guanylyltransferase (CobY/MobA/RfbA family)
MIVHGDLRDPTGIGDFVPMSDLTIVRDQHGTGTPVLVVPTYVDFRFQYGPGSARLHAEEGHRHGLSVSVLDNRWSFDIDEPADLAEEAKTRGPAGPLV